METSKECLYPPISNYITAQQTHYVECLLYMEYKSILRDHNQQTLCPFDVPYVRVGLNILQNNSKLLVQ